MPNTVIDVIFTYQEQFITSSSRVQRQTLVTNLSTALTFRIWSPGWGIKAHSGLQKSPVRSSGMSRFSCWSSNCQSGWWSFVRWLSLLSLRVKIYDVTIQMKPLCLYLHMVLFAFSQIKLWKFGRNFLLAYLAVKGSKLTCPMGKEGSRQVMLQLNHYQRQGS